MQNGDEASPSISLAGRGQLVKMKTWYNVYPTKKKRTT